MLSKRVAVVAVLLPLGIIVILLGGWIYNIIFSIILAGAGYEYYNIFKNGKFSPSPLIIIIGIIILAISRSLFAFEYTDLILTLCIFIVVTRHIIGYEKGEENAAIDFGVSLAGILYIGWLGSYLISMRSMPDGGWWIMLTLPAVWIADSAAYFVGKRFGKHPLTKRVSPKKSWEGYLGGVFFTTLLLPLLASFLSIFSPSITPIHGIILGLIISIIAPLGDLAESLFKRQFGIKDSSNILPGHGGILDRIDSWLWAVPIGYYLIYYFTRFG
jgi:phosphatidate cytidylyltransferase